DSDISTGTITLSDQHGHTATHTLTATEIANGTTGTLSSAAFSGFAGLSDQDTITVATSVTDVAGNTASASGTSFVLDNNADTGTVLSLTDTTGRVKTANVSVSLSGIDSDIASGSITLSDQHGHTAT